MKNIPLMMALKGRGMSVNKLAEAVGISHSRVSQTLNNIPGRGYLTRPKLARLLTPDELALVGWDSEGRQLAGTDAPAGRPYHEQQVEQSSM